MIAPIMQALPLPHLLCAALCVTIAASAPTHAQPQSAPDKQHSVREAVSSGRYKPLTEILAIVEQHVPGRVLEIEMENDLQRGGAIYEVEVLDANNRKHEIKIHAETGQLVHLDKSLPEKPMPLPQLLQQVLAQHPGFVEDVELEHTAGGQSVYTVKLIQPKGARLELLVHAYTGHVLGSAAPLDQNMQGMRPLHEILATLLQGYRGTVIEAELERVSPGTNIWHYEVDILLEAGGSIILEVDPKTGHVLREKYK